MSRKMMDELEEPVKSDSAEQRRVVMMDEFELRETFSTAYQGSLMQSQQPHS